MAKPKKGGKGRKTELVFDQQKRKDFLSGFRKRKQERRRVAKEELEKQVKEERKRIKQELRDGFQDQFKKSFAPLELDAELKQEEYDTENVTVQIVELSTDDIAESNNWIGRNKPVYERAANEKEANSGGEADDGDEAEEEQEEELVPGFGVKAPKKKPKAAKAAADAPTDGHNDGEASEKPKRRKRVTKLPDEVKSKRGMGQFFAKQAHNTLKHTQAFRMKDRLERNKSRKKARIEKEKKIKLQNKREKHTKNSAKGKSKKAPKFNKNSKK